MSTTECRSCGGEMSPLRYACPKCVTATRARLDELQPHIVVITAGLVPGRGWPDGQPRAGGYESRPPLNLDLLVALDYRSHLEGHGPDDDPNETTLSVLGSLHQLARYVRARRQDDELFESLPPTTVTGLTTYLRLHTEWCAWQTWGGQYVTVVRQLHAQGRRQARDVPPRPLGPCIEQDCPGSVFADPRDDDRGKCTANPAHRYTGLHLARLLDAQKAAS